jgi:serralysin
MQQITITLTTAKGLVIKKTLTKPPGHPVQLSLPPGAKLAVDVKGPSSGASAHKSKGVAKLESKRLGDDLILEGEGDRLVQVSGYYSTKEVSLGTLRWDVTEPVVHTEAPTANDTNVTPNTNVNNNTNVTTAANALSGTNTASASALTEEPSKTMLTGGSVAAMGGGNSGGMGWGSLAMGLGLAAAGGGGGGGGDGSAAVTANVPGATVSNQVVGVIAAGPVLAGHSLSVKLYQPSGHLMASASVDATGRFSADLGGYSGVVIVQVTSAGGSGDYKDEATGLSMQLNTTLLAVGSVSHGQTVLNVNPLTTLAAQKAGVQPTGTPSVSMTPAQAAAMNAFVAKAFGLTGDVAQLDVQAAIDISGNMQTPNTIGALLAAMSGMAAKSGAQQAAISELMACIDSNGVLSVAGITKLLEGANISDQLGGSATLVLTDWFAKGFGVSGFGFDKLAGHADNVLKPSSLVAGTSYLSGQVAAGTSLQDVSLSFGTSGTPVTQGLTLDATRGTWKYVLTAADVANLLGGLTGGQDGSETVQLLLGGKTKAVLGLMYNNTTDDAPRAVTFANAKSALAENAVSLSAAKLADIVVVDPDGATPGTQPVLSGADARKFEVHQNARGGFELWLAIDPALNVESTSSYSVTVSVGGTASQSFRLQITDANFAPLASGSASLAAVLEDAPNPTGATVNALFAANYSNGGHDRSDTLQGIAISGNAAKPAQGTWQWSSDGTHWQDILAGAVSASQALYLDALATLRFVPAANFNGTPGALSAHLVDSSQIGWRTGATVDVSVNAISSTWSSNTVSLSTSVTPVNDAPVVTNRMTDQWLMADGKVQTFLLPIDAFTDIDNPTLTVTATQPDGRALPSWLTFDASKGSFTAVASAAQTQSVRVTASDGSLSTFFDFVVKAIPLDQMNAPTMRLFADTGVSATDGITSNGKVMVDGLVLGATWQYSVDDGATWMQGVSNSFNLPKSDGTYHLKIKQTYGAVESIQNMFDVTLDTTAPVASIAGFSRSFSNDVADVTDTVGTALTGGSWGRSAYLLGESEAGSTVTLNIAGESKTVLTDPQGVWSYLLTDQDFAKVGLGAETIQVTRVMDTAGNVVETPLSHTFFFNALAATTSHPGSGYGSDYIDALVKGGTGWEKSAATILTYSFAPVDSDTPAWTASEKQAFANACQAYANVCNLKFVEGVYRDQAAESTSLVFHKVPQSTWTDDGSGMVTLADFQFPYDGANVFYGAFDGRFNYQHSSWSYLQAGGLGFNTILHELGHGLGLAHPFGNNSPETNFPGVTTWQDFGSDQLDQGVWTVMAYHHDWQNSPGNHTYGFKWGYGQTPMSFDVATMQALYGANTTFKTGNDTYVLPTAEQDGVGWQCIWDAGGVDTLSNAGASSACQINLNAYPKQGGVPSGGFVSYNIGNQIAGGFTIADGVDIENAIGGNGDDVLTGNALANSLSGGGGNDTLTGGAGADHFVFDTPLGLNNIDTVLDFNVAQGDKLDLSRQVFTKLTLGNALLEGQFRAGAGVQTAADANDYILYDTQSGALYYDSDGNGQNAAVQFAVLATKPTDLTVAQFVVI